MNETKPFRPIKATVLLIILLFLGGMIAGAGVIKVEGFRYISYMEAFGGSPIEDCDMNINYSRVVYSVYGIRFLERFDADSTNNWSYSEDGQGTATTGYSIIASTLNMSVKSDGGNWTNANYTHPATSKNGLKPTSGVILWGRMQETAGTPNATIGITDGTYIVKCGFDGDGNIDINYHNAAGTLTNIVVLASATANHWYTVMIEYYSTTAIVKLYNETGSQKGDTNELTTKMSYTDYSTVRLHASSTEATAETFEFDWAYSTKKVTTPKIKHEKTADNETSGAPLDAESSNIKFSYTAGGIENDSASSEARLAFGYDDVASDWESTKTYNATEFSKAMNTVSEVKTDITNTQDYYATGWNDLQDDTETDLEKSIEATIDDDIHIVDYYITDANMVIQYDENFQKLVEEFYKKDAVDIILEEDPEATVEMENGEILTAAKIPRELLAAFLLGITIDDLLGHEAYAGWGSSIKGIKGSIKKLQHTTPTKALAVRNKISKTFRKSIAGGLGIVQRNIKTTVSSTKSWTKKASNTVQRKSNVGEIKKLSRNWVVAPTNRIGTKLRSGATRVTSGLGHAKDNIINGGKFIKGKAFGAFSFMAKLKERFMRYLAIAGIMIAIVAVIGIILYAKYKGVIALGGAGLRV